MEIPLRGTYLSVSPSRLAITKDEIPRMNKRRNRSELLPD